MSYVSVIIPTLLNNLLILEKLIDILIMDEKVSEIILINNSQKEFFSSKPKIKIINPRKNLYVNRSWNLGVKEAKEEYFALFNDDLLVCQNFCSKCLSLIEKKTNFGVLGMDVSSVENKKDIEIPEDTFFYLEPSENIRNRNWGVIIIGKKSIYKEIPNKIKIWCGDDYIRYSIKQNNLKIYNLKGAKISHLGSNSCKNPNFGNILCKDIFLYSQVDKSFKKTKCYKNTKKEFTKKQILNAKLYTFFYSQFRILKEKLVKKERLLNKCQK